jgi:pimeloyl-ACP methyl ester carboxylesterase
MRESQSGDAKPPFVLVHGAWHGGWAWKKVVPLLRGAGHDVYTLSLTGMGDRAHLLAPAVDLRTHIQDVLNLLEYEDLQQVVLVGHSWGGMVITGAIDKASARLSSAIYLDAGLPFDGESFYDLLGGGATMQRQVVDKQGDGWKYPSLLPPQAFGVSAPDDVQWMSTRLCAHPALTFSQPVSLSDKVAARNSVPGAFIRATGAKPGEIGAPAPAGSPPGAFDAAAERAKSLGWPYYELATGHDAMVTQPGDLSDLLLRVATAAG